MNLKKEVALDEKKVRDGVWFNMETGSPVKSPEELQRFRDSGVACVLVRPIGSVNAEYKDRLTELTRPIRAQRRRGSRESNRLIEDSITEAAAWEVIKDWFNLEDGEDVIDYSPEAAIELMKKYEMIREDWIDYATELYHFRLQEVAEGAKNSLTLSPMN